MPKKWEPIAFEKMFTNVQETALTRASAALENMFQNETKGFSRFPGLRQVATFSGSARVYLGDFRGALMVACGGKIIQLDNELNQIDVTGVPLSGAGRCIFAEADDMLLMAAGREIIRFAGTPTEILSEDAPLASHVVYVNGYVLADEVDSGTFFHSGYGTPTAWDPLDVFAANSKPENINAIAVTPYRELLVAGTQSIEQYERLTTGDVPFFLRWAVGDGIMAPYTLIATKDGNWAVNDKAEFVRFTGQVSQSVADDVGLTLEGVDDWTDAWAEQANIKGQKFIILQAPNATNVYGTIGITLLYDFRQSKWYSLYGWDDELALPARWPGWSYHRLWNRHFVGGEGVLYELDSSTYNNAGQVQRVLGRTAHIDAFGEVSIDNIQMRVKRGVGSNTVEPFIALRCLRDNKTWSRWVRKGLGLAGKRDMFIEFGGFGMCSSFQFEWYVTDECELEIVSLQGQFSPLGD